MTRTKVLIVEDDKDLRQGLTVRLQASGFEVCAAGDGLTAVSAAQREHPDVVLLDIGLPAGDGLTVMRRLHRLTHLANVPVIVLTGRDPLTVYEPAMEHGAFAFFEKPVDNSELVAAVRAASARHRQVPDAPSREHDDAGSTLASTWFG